MIDMAITGCQFCSTICKLCTPLALQGQNIQNVLGGVAASIACFSRLSFILPSRSLPSVEAAPFTMKYLYDIRMAAVPILFAGSHFGWIGNPPFLGFKIRPLGIFLLP